MRNLAGKVHRGTEPGYKFLYAPRHHSGHQVQQLLGVSLPWSVLAAAAAMSYGAATTQFNPSTRKVPGSVRRSDGTAEHQALLDAGRVLTTNARITVVPNDAGSHSAAPTTSPPDDRSPTVSHMETLLAKLLRSAPALAAVTGARDDVVAGDDVGLCDDIGFCDCAAVHPAHTARDSKSVRRTRVHDTFASKGTRQST